MVQIGPLDENVNGNIQNRSLEAHKGHLGDECYNW